MTITDQKKKLRKEMLSRRSKLPEPAKAKYDQWICHSILKKIEEQHYSTIHCYLPMGSEINILPLIETLLEKGITVITPKTLPGRKMKNLILESLDKLKKGVFGTSYPASDKEFDGDFDLIIVPGLSFDCNNYRLGYGGGYYDRFINNHPLARKLGAFYPFQEVEKIPIESHDVRLDEVLINKDFPGFI